MAGHWFLKINFLILISCLTSCGSTIDLEHGKALITSATPKQERSDLPQMTPTQDNVNTTMVAADVATSNVQLAPPPPPPPPPPSTAVIDISNCGNIP